MPVIAALVGLSLVVHAWLQAGPTINISFQTAEGLTPGKTPVKYKSVTIGKVEKVRLGKDRDHVVVKVALEKSAESFATADTRFWVVRPRIGLGGVSGVGTLLSGAYIGADIGDSKEEKYRFKGLELRRRSPTVRPGAASCCMPRIWVRSTWARRSITGASRWARWRPINWTRMAAASPSGFSWAVRTTTSSRLPRVSGMPVAWMSRWARTG
ncbi:paraquat-inducible protein B [Rhodanobacter sp. 115]|nr:paraquat-inducible protein B [Rhodanobacter sp. 115]